MPNPDAPHAHKSRAPHSVGCAVVTVSDTRTLETDEGGALVAGRLAGAGHPVRRREIVRDDPPAIEAAISRGLADPSVQAVITTGGTGISSRDSTYEVVSRVLDKRIDGFGELFRYLSFQEIGTAAVMSRAVAGVAGGKVVIAIPGSPHACALAMDRLVLPEIGHMVEEVSR